MPLRFIGYSTGFAQRTYTHTEPTKYLKDIFSTEKHRSPVTQSGIRDDLFQFQNSTSQPDCPFLRLAISRAYSAFRLPQPVKMIHLNDVFCQDLDIWNKSPCLPWSSLGYKTKGDIKNDPEAIRKVRLFWHRVKAHEDLRPPDCMAFVRPHVCLKTEKKLRAVWGYPATVTFGEAVFALPLIRAYQTHRRPIAYGYETALGGMRRIYQRFMGKKFYYGLDFSKFDKTVPTWLIHAAFSILASNIDFLNYEDHGVADVRRMYHMFRYIENYFVNTPIRMADGLRYRKSSGIASGSYFTQLVGSIVNHILIEWACISLVGKFPDDVIVLGDDSLFTLPVAVPLDDFEALFSTVGMHLNLSKSQITTELDTMTFLGYKIGRGIPSKDHDDWITALLFPETPDRCFADLQSRALGLYYANMCVDQRFASITAGLVKMKAFDLNISRGLERHLKFIGVALDVLQRKHLPSAFEFAKLMI
uniref:RdRp n=1 Tax=Hubei partiti-like virus 46 TaxID=1923054 RepID=A0A1L3KLK6_9VIRU|nr:RdRp [Hubei partiti-like virus 46]